MTIPIGKIAILATLLLTVPAGFGDTAPEVRNHLGDSASLYLRQHVRDPIDWYPWGPEALNLARKSGKPIFLSIGYAACRWGHVMARESFSHPAVAQVLNENFICVLVDREERPDLDDVYMSVVMTLTGRGGWPLNLFLTPDGQPFSVGTYLPRATLLETATRIAGLWRKNRSSLTAAAEHLTAAVTRSAGPRERRDDAFNAQLEKTAWTTLRQSFDRAHGGFGAAPKFPAAPRLMFLLRYAFLTGETAALSEVFLTLNRMRQGGIYDQLGGGFFRYATDDAWKVPCFEKVLCDQALLLMVYTEAEQLSGQKKYLGTVRELFHFLESEMVSPEGAFYSSIGADDGYYLWRYRELRTLLSPGEFGLARRIFNFRTEGNFHPETGEVRGGNILYRRTSFYQLARELNADEGDLRMLSGQIVETLRHARNQRTPPVVDRKIIAGWNGLAIAALARAGMATGNRQYLEAAIRAADFITGHLRRPDGALDHCFLAGRPQGTAVLDDYAAMIWAMLELYEATFDPRYLESARDWTRYVTRHFADAGRGGYYDTSDRAEQLVFRPYTVYDGALPSGTGVMVLNLLRLAALTGDAELAAEAEKRATANATEVNRSPENSTMLLNGLMFARYPAWEICVVGTAAQPDTRRLLNALRQPFCPFKSIVLMTPNERGVTADGIHRMIAGRPTAYFCRNRNCQPPVTAPEAVAPLLNVRTWNDTFHSDRK